MHIVLPCYLPFPISHLLLIILIIIVSFHLFEFLVELPGYDLVAEGQSLPLSLDELLLLLEVLYQGTTRLLLYFLLLFGLCLNLKQMKIICRPAKKEIYHNHDEFHSKTFFNKHKYIFSKFIFFSIQQCGFLFVSKNMFCLCQKYSTYFSSIGFLLLKNKRKI